MIIARNIPTEKETMIVVLDAWDMKDPDKTSSRLRGYLPDVISIPKNWENPFFSDERFAPLRQRCMVGDKWRTVITVY